MSSHEIQNREAPAVQILELTQNRAVVRVGDEESDFTLIPREEGVYDVQTPTGWSRLYVTRTERGIWWVHHDGKVYEIDKSRHSSEDSDASDDASGKIRAPTPAKVAAVLVAVGAEVGEDDSVVVLEAMKTEQSLTAGVRGTVTEVNVEEGQQVAMDELLVVVEPASDGAEDDL